MAILNINGTNYSQNVVVGSYNVNSTDEFNSWKDANGIEHRQIIRQKVSGKFQVGFRNPSEYADFVETINSGKTKGGWIPCDLFVNNLNHSKSCKLYISMSPSMTRYGTRNMMSNFEVSVTEM